MPVIITKKICRFRLRDELQFNDWIRLITHHIRTCYDEIFKLYKIVYVLNKTNEYCIIKKIYRVVIKPGEKKQINKSHEIVYNVNYILNLQSWRVINII